jgi:hypothetical protein
MKLCQICNNTTSYKYCSPPCRKEGKLRREREYIKTNKGKIRLKTQEYIYNNKEKIIEYNREWAKANKEHCFEYNKKWFAENSEYIKKFMSDYYFNNKDSITAKNKERIQKNPEYYEQRRRESSDRYMEKYYTDPRVRIRHAVSNTFARIAAGKIARTEELLGCTLEEAKDHIESQFVDGMSWNNYGEWHIDHVRPVASIDPNCEEDLKFVCNIHNLQPLWAKDNICKGANYNGVNYRGHKKRGQHTLPSSDVSC